jgi:hypothetical protein
MSRELSLGLRLPHSEHISKPGSGLAFYAEKKQAKRRILDYPQRVFGGSGFDVNFASLAPRTYNPPFSNLNS